MYSPHALDKNLARLLELYQTDMSLVQIAKQLRVSLATLQAKIKELGLKRKPRLRKKIDDNLFKQLAEIGLTNVQIAEKLGLHERTVSNYKRQLGLPCRDEEKIAIGKKAAACREYYKKTGMRPECPATKNVLEKYKKTVISLLEQGTSKTKIAKRYGVCLSTVYNFIHLYGLDVPQKRICDNQDKQIIEAFNQGKSLEDISQQLHCSSRTLRRKTKGMNLGFRRIPKNTDWSIFQGHDEKLIQMRQNGMTLRQIGNHFGVNANTVHYRLKKLSNIEGYQHV